MGRVSKRKRQLKGARKKSIEAIQEKKRVRLEENQEVSGEEEGPGRLWREEEHRTPALPPSPPSQMSSLPPPASPQPSTSHATISHEGTEHISRYSIREQLLENIQVPAPPFQDTENIIISKAGLESLHAFHCSCKKATYDYNYVHDGFDTCITIKCRHCGLQKEFFPETLADTGRKTTTFKTTVGLVYLSVIEDYGITGLRRLLGVLGMPSVGYYKYYRYLRYLFTKMKEHYKTMQSKIHLTIRKYYEDHSLSVPDEDGVIRIDISYGGTSMKRGHTSNIGMGVIIEVCTGFVIDFELLSKYCCHCAKKHALLKTKKITGDDFNAWKATHKEKCTINYTGTSEGMEAAGATRLFGRSLDHKFKYENFDGDGDSSAYNAVIGMNNGKGPYEDTSLWGLTQNANKSFHAKMLALTSKEKFVGLCRLQFVAQTAVLDHNFGHLKASLLNALEMKTTRLEQALKIQDKVRRRSSHTKTLPRRKK